MIIRWIICFLMLGLLVSCSGGALPEQSARQDPAEHSAEQTQEKVNGTAAVRSHTANSSPKAAAILTTEPQQSAMLNVPLIAQNPELPYGCEVTSLAMVLRYAGIPADKMKLAAEMPMDTDQVYEAKPGDIQQWGNPEHGFVGDVTGKSRGYAIYAKPLEKLMAGYLPGRTLNLTGKPFAELLRQVERGRPVIIWTTGDFQPPDRWEKWRHGNEEINAPLDLHAVVLVGYDPEYVYVNDPLAAQKSRKVRMQPFIISWEHLGKQALSYH